MLIIVVNNNNCSEIIIIHRVRVFCWKNARLSLAVVMACVCV